MKSWRYGAVASFGILCACTLSACGGEQGGAPSGIAAAVTNAHLQLGGVAIPANSNGNGQAPMQQACVGSGCSDAGALTGYAVLGALFAPAGTVDIRVTIEGALANGGNLVDDIVAASATPTTLSLATVTVPNVLSAGSTQQQVPAAGTVLTTLGPPPSPGAAAPQVPYVVPVVLPAGADCTMVASYNFLSPLPTVAVAVSGGGQPNQTVNVEPVVGVVYTVNNLNELQGTNTFSVQTGTFDMIVQFLNQTPPNTQTAPNPATVIATVAVTNAKIAVQNTATGPTVVVSQGITALNSQAGLNVGISDKPRGSK